MAVVTQIQFRRGTAAQWTTTNPTLAAGEFGWESDTNKAKIGTGSTAWTALAYAITGDVGDITEVLAGTGISVASGTGPVPTVSVSAAVAAPALVANSGDSYGYIGTPQASKADNYTLVLADAGKDIFVTVTGKTITIPANASVAFQIGTGFTVTNESAVTTTIAITTDTLILANSASTGSRTLAPYGVAVFKKVTATKWIASGNGLT